MHVCCTPACRVVDSRALYSLLSFCSSLSSGCRSHHLLWDTHCQIGTLTFLHTQEKLIHSKDKHAAASATALKQHALLKSSIWTEGGIKRASFHLKHEHCCFWEFSRRRNVLWLNLKVSYDNTHKKGGEKEKMTVRRWNKQSSFTGKKAVYFGSQHTKGSAAKLTQTNKFAFDKTTATTLAFYTKPTLFPASLSLWLATFVRSHSVNCHAQTTEGS